MGLFEKIFGGAKRLKAANGYFRMLNGYTPIFNSWGGKIYESELVRSAIHAKAIHMSKMSVRIQGTAKPQLQRALRDRPNEWQTWSQFLYRWATILEMNTVAIVVQVRNVHGEVTGIAVVLPECTEVVNVNGDAYLRMTFADGHTAAERVADCGISTKFQYRNDLFGDGNSALTNTMQLVDIQTQGIIEGVKNSASYRFMAQYSNVAFGDDLEKEQKRFNKSVAKDGGTALLFPANYTNVKQITNTPFVVNAAQMAAIESNISNYFGVNTKIMQNSASADELDSFYNGALEPLAIQLSEVLTKMLFSDREKGYGAKVFVCADRLQYMSVESKINIIQTLGDRGMIRINEARALLNYEPIDGGDELMPIRGEYYNAKDETSREEEDDNADSR